jgi:hypothetical protein
MLILMFSHDWTAQGAHGESCYSAADDENHDFSEPDMKSSRMIARGIAPQPSSSPMIVHHMDLCIVTSVPAEYDTPLIIDSNRM